MKLLDWKIMNNDGLKEMIENGFILYGASQTGNKTIQYLESLGLLHKIVKVIDSDSKKWGKDWNGFKIYSPETLHDIADSISILVTSVFVMEINEHLNKLGFEKKWLASIQCFRVAIHYAIMNGYADDYLETSIVTKYKLRYKMWCDFANSDVVRSMPFNTMCKTLMRFSESILIHTIPKTGTMTLVRSFSNTPNVVVTSHKAYYDENSYKKLRNILQEFNEHKVKIITGIREPIEHAISTMWQSIPTPFMHNDSCFGNLIDENWCDFSMDTWLEEQLSIPFGIDVFKESFEKTKGYSILEKGNISLFVYRLDFLNSLEEKLGQFVGVKNFKLLNDNIAKNKPYSVAYRYFLEEVKISKSYLEKIMDCKIMQHFYTLDERKDYYEKWKKHISEFK